MMILPQEIIDEILYRLPVKSLFRFKSVCKRWLSTISGPSFDLYYKRQFNSIFAITSNGQIPKLYFIDDADKSDDATPINSFSISVPPLILKEHYNKPCTQRAISNACNGLVLLHIAKDSLVLFNPSTRYSVKALTLDCLDSTYLSYCDSFGLCYDASIDDYKALVLRPSYSVSLVFVSCLKSEKWVRINDAPFNVRHSIRGPLVNGHIHWTIPGEENDQTIIYFDESKNNFEVLPSPPEQNDHQYPLLGCGVLDGCLSIARRSEGVHNCIEHNVEVVAMKIYGVAESWTTLYVLSNLQVRYLRCLVPLHLSRNGEEFLFMTNSNDIWAYNPTKRLIQRVALRPIWAIRYALKLCKGVPIETDYQPAVRLIQGEEDEEYHPERVLIEDCRNLIREMNTAVILIFREANHCADELAKLGGNQGEQAVHLLVPPEDLIEDTRADMQGLHFQRGMPVFFFVVLFCFVFVVVFLSC